MLVDPEAQHRFSLIDRRAAPAPYRDAHIQFADTPAAIRARLDRLRGEGILELERGVYQASEIALTSGSRTRMQVRTPRRA